MVAGAVGPGWSDDKRHRKTGPDSGTAGQPVGLTGPLRTRSRDPVSCNRSLKPCRKQMAQRAAKRPLNCARMGPRRDPKAASRRYDGSNPKKEPFLTERHMTLNHLYDVDGDRATGRATTVVSIATASGYKIMGQGAYHDDLVKIDDEWKIRYRRVVNDHLVSDPAEPVNLADPDVAALVQQLIDTADDLARRGTGE